MRLLLPYLDSTARAEILRYAWQGAAALHSGLSGRAPAAQARPAPDAADLVDRAVATGDEHAIKFTEACLREHAVRARPVYLAAARAAVRLMG